MRAVSKGTAFFVQDSVLKAGQHLGTAKSPAVCPAIAVLLAGILCMNGKMNSCRMFCRWFFELQAKPQAPPGIPPGKHPKIAQTPGKTSGAAWNSAWKMRIWREQYIRSVRPLRRHAPPKANHSKYMRAIKGFTHICRRICDKITLTNFSGGTAYGT